MTPNTQITPETVGMLKAGDWLKFNHTPEAYGGNGIVQVKSTGDFALCLVGDPWPDYNPTRFTYIGPDLGDGWIGWLGGKNPVPGMRIETRRRDGFEGCPRASEGARWTPRDEPDQFDIIAFRPAASSPSAVGVGHLTAAERAYGEDRAASMLNTYPTPAPAPSAGDVTEKVDWERVGPKLVEALEKAATWLDDLADVAGSERARAGSHKRWKHDTIKDWARRTRSAAALAAATPGGK